MRIYYTNPYGFRLDNIEKVKLFKTRIEQLEIDCFLMSIIDKRWDNTMLDKMEYHISEITPKVIMNSSDGRDSTYI